MHQSSAFYTPAELVELGCSSVGRWVQVSRLASFYGFIGTLGDHTRIDDFVIVKGRVDIGCFAHISAFCLLGGTAGTITFGDFSTTAAYVGIYTASDDYASPLLTNSVVPQDLKRGISGDVTIGKGVIIGAHSVVLPRAMVHDYATIGAQCIVNGEFTLGGIYVTGAGRPRRIGQRDINSIKTAEDEARRRLAEKQP
jgi:carbonic anhydrase/acetyltransferase-like protein (isoleucine patch superfamily)